MAEATCLWCQKPFGPRRGGECQRFCCPRHRIEFHTAARLCAERAMVCGLLTVGDLRNGPGEPCKLRPWGQSAVPLPDIWSADPALLDAPTCRMPLGQASGFSRADPGGRGTPRFRHRSIGFRHFIGGSLALASLNLACRDQVPTFPQRSLPSLLTTAACGGLRPAPDCRPRRALLHLSYSSVPSYSDGAFVTHAPKPTLTVAGPNRRVGGNALFPICAAGHASAPKAAVPAVLTRRGTHRKGPYLCDRRSLTVDAADGP
jgi:hypothetical protein